MYRLLDFHFKLVWVAGRHTDKRRLYYALMLQALNKHCRCEPQVVVVMLDDLQDVPDLPRLPQRQTDRPSAEPTFTSAKGQQRIQKKLLTFFSSVLVNLTSRHLHTTKTWHLTQIPTRLAWLPMSLDSTNPLQHFRWGSSPSKSLLHMLIDCHVAWQWNRPPKFADKYEERDYLKGRLAAAFRIFGKYGFDEGVAGHITLRDPVDPQTFWVNPFG